MEILLFLILLGMVWALIKGAFKCLGYLLGLGVIIYLIFQISGIFNTIASNINVVLVLVVIIAVVLSLHKNGSQKQKDEVQEGNVDMTTMSEYKKQKSGERPEDTAYAWNQDKKSCPKCGGRLEIGWRMCPFCGYGLH